MLPAGDQVIILFCLCMTHGASRCMHPGSAAYELALLYVNAILGSLFAFQLTANQMRSC